MQCPRGTLVEVLGLLIAVASLVAEHSSAAVAHGLSCSSACGILLGQRLNPSLPNWQADSLPLSHQGSPGATFNKASIPFKRASPSWLKHLPKALPTILRGFPGGSVGKQSSCNAADTKDAGSFPGLGRTPGGGRGNPLQYSCLENLMDRRAWRVTVHGIAKSQTRLKQLSMTHKYSPSF